MAKSEIIERLGEAAVLLPDLIAAALAANDRAKVRLSLLQEAAAQAASPGRKGSVLEAERRAAGLADPRFDQTVSGAEAVGAKEFKAPGARLLVEGLRSDLAAMLAPLEAAGVQERGELDQRFKALAEAIRPPQDDVLERAAVGLMTSARRDGPDSFHLLIMDLHRAINRLAGETAVEEVAGAKVHHLGDWDRARVRAFMRGLSRTAPLAFGHPGLATTAARAGERLIIQNDIGETDAHVLVLHVEALEVTATYTDVHRRRAKFFMGLFDRRVAWSPLSEQAAKGLGEEEVFYLVTGRFAGEDEAALDEFLEFLGSRIVFLIDWNKARKALQSFVSRDAAIALLEWGAAHDLGHRAFLEAGGVDLVFETVRKAAAGRVPYGVRLEAALGETEAVGFLRRVLKETSEALRAGRSARLIRDEIQADLAQRFDTAEAAVLAIVVRHLGLSRVLAGTIAEALSQEAGGAPALAARAKRLEAKADRLTLEAREICARLRHPQAVRRLVDEVEDAMDALDECAFLMSLPPGPPPGDPLPRLANIVVECLGQAVRAVEASIRLPAGRREDAVAALQAIDATTAAERAADEAERAAVGAFMGEPAPDARPLMLGLEIARALEAATDHLAHAALALRERVLEELSA
ncbi:MAG: hypothetical protein JO127_01610 [Caulobacteraceae bacterium]|nr:hypothetical protein [Caulobacteraceae bacterium]